MKMKAFSVLGAIALFGSVARAADGWTDIHEAGRCAIRGTCGKQGFFGSELPCPDNGKADTPDAALRTKLVSICGEKWQDSDVCCTNEQVCLIYVTLDACVVTPQEWQQP